MFSSVSCVSVICCSRRPAAEESESDSEGERPGEGTAPTDSDSDMDVDILGDVTHSVKAQRQTAKADSLESAGMAVQADYSTITLGSFAWLS